MLINPSPTTLLAMWLSGCAAGRAGGGGQRQAGQGRAPAAHNAPARPRCCSAAEPRGHPGPDPRTSLLLPGWASAGVTAMGGRIRLLAEQQRQRGQSRRCTTAGEAEEASPSLPAEQHHVPEGCTVGCVMAVGCAAGSARRSRTGFVSCPPAPPALQTCQLLWRHRLVSAGGA